MTKQTLYNIYYATVGKFYSKVLEYYKIVLKKK